MNCSGPLTKSHPTVMNRSVTPPLNAPATPSAKQPMPNAAISTDMTLMSSRLGSRAATKTTA